ncbi:MAG TPA: cysteine rich repeat-containing protein [Anaeromyxobacteraceae bacterium]|nr:cysteine rich repeat-containing protein [Anaeromyxobacteraceae bacterium]
MKTFARIVSIALIVLGVANADDACRTDVEKLCAGIPQGGGRILSCLKANEAKVSPACKQEVSAFVKKVREFGAPCQADVNQFCGDVTMGGGAILKCLASNSAKISPGCQTVVKRVEEKSGEFRKACADDALRFCQGIPKGHGRILACLKSKNAELTPTCQAMMQSLAALMAAPTATPATTASAPLATPATSALAK